MARPLSLLFLLPLLLLGLAGCATDPDPSDTLETALKHYEKALRWSAFDAVGRLHRPMLTDPSLAEMGRAVKVTRYETVQAPVVDLAAGNAGLVVRVTYYRLDSASLRTQDLLLTLEYDDAHHRWWFVNDFPSFP